MSIQPITRERDEVVLRVLNLLAMGLPQMDIARHMGLSRPQVSVMRQRVMAADLKESGEPEHVVLAGYGA